MDAAAYKNTIGRFAVHVVHFVHKKPGHTFTSGGTLCLSQLAVAAIEHELMFLHVPTSS